MTTPDYDQFIAAMASPSLRDCIRSIIALRALAYEKFGDASRASEIDQSESAELESALAHFCVQDMRAAMIDCSAEHFCGEAVRRGASLNEALYRHAELRSGLGLGAAPKGAII